MLRGYLTALQDAALSESAADLDSVRDHLAQVVSRALEPAHELGWVSCHRLYTGRVVLLFAVRDPAGQLSALAGLPASQKVCTRHGIWLTDSYHPQLACAEGAPT